MTMYVSNDLNPLETPLRGVREAEESQVTKAAKRGIKRKETNHDESVLSPIENKKIRPIDKEKKSSLLKGLDPVKEIFRDDAFLIGAQIKRTYELTIAQKLSEANLLSVEEASKYIKTVEAGIKLKKWQYELIAEITNKISAQLAVQLFELFQILESKNFTNKIEGKAIIHFAKDLIYNIPSKDESEMDIEEDMEEDPNSEIIALTCETMGLLLLNCQNDIKATAACLNSPDLKHNVERIVEFSYQLLSIAKEKITLHSKNHQDSAIQGVDEATFIMLSVEFAKTILLDSGIVNFGILDKALEVLIPDNFKGTVAIENFQKRLEDICSTSEVWQELAALKPANPKNIPSDLAIRSLLDIPPKQTLTKQDTRVFVLSALLAHFRQANAGTCFTTAFLIKSFDHLLEEVTSDFCQLTEKGELVKGITKEDKAFPFQTRLSNEYLYITLKVDQNGKILTTKNKKLPPYKEDEWPKPKNDQFLFEAPGIRAVCNIIGIDNIKDAISDAIETLGNEFTVNELIKKLAEISFLKQQTATHWLRDQKRFTLQEIIERGQYAYGCQTNHPLHRAYEQAGASMVDYFGSQYAWPAFIHQTMEEILKTSAKGYSLEFQSKYKRLLKEMFLPMIIRMKYRYNHDFEDYITLFPDSHVDIRGHYNFGYELYDTALPNDFVYSTKLHSDYANERSYITLERFSKYKPDSEWKRVNTKEKFVEFVLDLVNETVAHIIGEEKERDKIGLWSQVSEKMLRDIGAPNFADKMVINQFGRGGDQKKKLLKNEHSIATTPWKYRWGGSYNSVMKTYFGLSKSPSQTKNFIGSQREVLAKCINFMKKQPEHLARNFLETDKQIIVESPCHAFLLLPSSESFSTAWQSEMSTTDYIEDNVETPGLKIANMKATTRMKNKLIEFVANNLWVSKAHEKHDFNKQQLTDSSKEAFDMLIANEPNLFRMKVVDFEKNLNTIVAKARASDPKIGKRNSFWEKGAAKALKATISNLFIKDELGKPIGKENAIKLINYMRDRVDNLYLTQTGSQQFLELAKNIPNNLSVNALSRRILVAASKARLFDTNLEDRAWLKGLQSHLETLLFSLLPKRVQNQAISHGIVTHDTNWKSGIHDLFFIFMVNPSSAKLELVTYNPDLETVNFMGQSAWFPNGKNNIYASWSFPDNYRLWPGEPLMNAKKLLDL